MFWPWQSLQEEWNLAWASTEPSGWQVVHVRPVVAGVFPGPWQAAHPPWVAWIAVTSVPPVWHPVPAVAHDGTDPSVCLSAAASWYSPVTWQDAQSLLSAEMASLTGCRTLALWHVLHPAV